VINGHPRRVRPVDRPKRRLEALDREGAGECLSN
jgi:hypothetical protein